MKVSEGLGRLLFDGTTVMVSVEIWLDIINNKDMASQKDQIK